MKKYARWSAKEDQYLRDNYEFKSRRELAKDLNRTAYAVKSRLDKLNVRKSPEAISSVCKRPNTGQIKKGNTPVNYKPVGSILLVKDKEGRSYYKIKVHDKRNVPSIQNYRFLHRYVYESTHGQIPKGKIVVFKDGNTLNCHPDNLELISRVENMKRNSATLNLSDGMIVHWLSNKGKNPVLAQALKNRPEIIKAKRAQLKLKRQINELERKTEQR